MIFFLFAGEAINGETFYLLIADFLLHIIWVVLKSLWSFCDKVATSDIVYNELKD